MAVCRHTLILFVQFFSSYLSVVCFWFHYFAFPRTGIIYFQWFWRLATLGFFIIRFEHGFFLLWSSGINFSRSYVCTLETIISSMPVLLNQAEESDTVCCETTTNDTDQQSRAFKSTVPGLETNEGFLRYGRRCLFFKNAFVARQSFGVQAGATSYHHRGIGECGVFVG